MARRLGRYVVLDELAAGGMARVHIGKLTAEGGFSRVVAIKVLHAQYANDDEFRKMFLDEARLVAQIRHPNVVSTLDVLADQGELFLVMDYVHGLPLSRILRDVVARDEQIPIPVVSAILCDALEGLHAAHEVCGENGVPLAIVHRDVSPQNIMVGNDGLAHVVDFGVAHATDRLQRTVPGQIKGKASYMAPEQATGEKVDRRADVYAAAVVLWETLAGERLFQGDSFAAVIIRHLQEQPAPPSTRRREIPPELDAVAMRGLSKQARDRFATGHEMAAAIERAVPRASRAEVASWVQAAESEFFVERDALLAGLPRETPDTAPPRTDADTLTEVPVERELATTVVEEVPAGAVTAGGARRRRIVVVTSAAVLAPLLVVGALATRHALRSGAASPEPGPVASSERGAPPPASATDPGEPVAVASAPSVEPSRVAAASASASAPPRPSAPGRHSSSSASQRDTAAAASARPSETTCCTPDGRLQIHFHDCVDNCKN